MFDVVNKSKELRNRHMFKVGGNEKNQLFETNALLNFKRMKDAMDPM